MQKKTTLQFKDGTSDKTYEVWLEATPSGKSYKVNFAYGRTGGNLKTGTKTSRAVALEKAEEIFEKLVAEKKKKGYKAKKGKASAKKKTAKSGADKTTAKKKTQKKGGDKIIKKRKTRELHAPKSKSKGPKKKVLSKRIVTKLLINNPHITKEDHTRVGYTKRGSAYFAEYEEIAYDALEFISTLRGEACFGVTEITEKVARELAKMQGAYTVVKKSGLRVWQHSLELPKLKSISDDCLAELTKFKGILRLNALEKLSDYGASILSGHQGADHSFYKDDKNLENYPSSRGEKFEWGLELKLLRFISEISSVSLAKYNGASIAFDSLKDIPEPIALALKKYKGKLYLEPKGMRNPEMVFKHLEKQLRGDVLTPETLKYWGLEMIKCSVCSCAVYPSDIPSGSKNLIARTFDGAVPSGKHWDKCDPCLWEELISE